MYQIVERVASQVDNEVDVDYVCFLSSNAHVSHSRWENLSWGWMDGYRRGTESPYQVGKNEREENMLIMHVIYCMFQMMVEDNWLARDIVPKKSPSTVY